MFIMWEFRYGIFFDNYTFLQVHLFPKNTLDLKPEHLEFYYNTEMVIYVTYTNMIARKI